MKVELLPQYTPRWSGCVVALGAERGKARRDLLRNWIEATSDLNVTFVSCNLHEGGIWAGLKDLMEIVLATAREEAPDLVQRHSYEITAVLPALRAHLKIEYVPLTESVPAQERVRQYALDRAFRILHGLIDFVAAWRERSSAPPWVIVCDDFDEAGALVQRFFRELIRRRGKSMGLTLVLGLRAEKAATLLQPFEGSIERHLLTRDLPPQAAGLSPEISLQRALELEDLVGGELVKLEIHLPMLISSWETSSTPDRALRWKAMAFAIYNHFGFYEDALLYGEAVRPHIDAICTEDPRFSRWQLVGGLYNSYICIGAPDRALEVMECEALQKLRDPADLERAYYIMAMLHARFLPGRNLALAEEFIEKGLGELERSNEAPDEKHFFKVFLWNGLALIRHRQGRPEEAIELCSRGSRYLEEHLSADRHLLHRSVLLYNLGQVYASINALKEGIGYYSAAIEMDPFYSEYFNERGNLFLRAGDPERAIEDYRRAIVLSPPYFEVLANLGQAYKQLSKFQESEQAFSRAIDLEPKHSLAFVGRAQANEALGHTAAAIADYSTALDLDPAQPLVWANRASLAYESGQLESAVSDLDEAIRQAPKIPDLLRNRALALSDLGWFSAAANDLREFLHLSTDLRERSSVESWLHELEARDTPMPVPLQRSDSGVA